MKVFIPVHCWANPMGCNYWSVLHDNAERSSLVEAVLAQCPCSDGFAFPLQWLHISNWNFQVFHEVGGHGSQGTESPSRNHKTAEPWFHPTSAHSLAVLTFLGSTRKLRAKFFVFPLGQLKKNTFPEQNCSKEMLSGTKSPVIQEREVRWMSWGSLALACPAICNTEKAEILLISLCFVTWMMKPSYFVALLNFPLSHRAKF